MVQGPPPWLPAQGTWDVSCPPAPSPTGLQSLYFPGLVGVASCPSRRRAQQSQRNTERPEPESARQGHQVEAGSEQEQTQGHPRHDTCQSSARLTMQTAAAPSPPQGSRDHSLGRGMARSSHGHLHPGLQLPRSSKVPTNLHKLPTASCPVCRPEQTGLWSLGGGS